VFVGDTLFYPDVGTARCDFPNGSAEVLWDSIQKLLSLPDETCLYLCHDYPPAKKRGFKHCTTVGQQKKENIHVGNDTKKDDFVKFRIERDLTLSPPRLIEKSVQANLRGGVLPNQLGTETQQCCSEVLHHMAENHKVIEERVKNLENEIFTASQLTIEQTEELINQHCIKSIINLRSETEEGFRDDSEISKLAGADYHHWPIKIDELNIDYVNKLLKLIHNAPKPTLIFCRSNFRASAIALLYVAKRDGKTYDELMKHSENYGFKASSQAKMDQFLKEFMEAEISL
jgi:uncharacterized protein (TIGR01244 family)